MGLFHKACDRCRSRKSRCRVEESVAEVACQYCHSRNLPCTFSYQKHRQRRKNPDEIVRAASSRATSIAVSRIPTQVISSTPVEQENDDGHTGLYIDYLLDRNQFRQLSRPNSSHDQLTTLLGPSPNISFFPAKRVQAISQRLGHTKLENLLDAIRVVIASRLKSSSSPALSNLDDYFFRNAENAHQPLPQPSVEEYIRSYMQQIHPFHPFLDEINFEKRALSPSIGQDLATDKAWACLYYAVLAVGCQHSDGGGYEARTGSSWSFFERALALWRDNCLLRGSLTSLQALMAMAIFCEAVSGFGLGSAILAEAAVLAQHLGISRLTSASDNASTRTFWVLYYMEKISCFTTGKVPTIQDAHISCPLPDTSVRPFSDYDWFVSFVRYARLVSRIQSRLLTISSVPQPWAARYSAVKSLQSELQAWRDAIPSRFRPGEPLRPRLLLETHAVSIALRCHYYYHYAYQTLTWTLLHCENDGLDAGQLLDLRTELMQTARSMLELTSYIEISPSTPLWLLAIMPLSSLMILFDLVIHNPSHPETSLNMALLDIASGHFSRIEYSSNGVLPGSLISEFAHLARQYISDIRLNTGRQQGYQTTAKNTGFRIAQPPHNRLSLSANANNAPAEPHCSHEMKVSSDPPSQRADHAIVHQQVEQPSSGHDLCTSLPDMSSVGANHDALFFPQVDGSMDDLQFLGVDLMGLFDPAFYP
ncbi:fungal-specific transcription factor domain-containing protein [Aspergillus keveii]|uniref:Fungal-specific transcription factor domain-containing protein n=1 Tax=Aspergillus keveii TaxID=714993 RepID=A0ABR4G6F5_9EURO